MRAGSATRTHVPLRAAGTHVTHGQVCLDGDFGRCNDPGLDREPRLPELWMDQFAGACSAAQVSVKRCQVRAWVLAIPGASAKVFRLAGVAGFALSVLQALQWPSVLSRARS